MPIPVRIDPVGYADVMDACRTGCFGAVLLGLTSRLAPVEEIYFWYREPDGAPIELAAASWLDDQLPPWRRVVSRLFLMSVRE